MRVALALVVIVAGCHADRPRAVRACAGEPPAVASEPGRQVIQAAHATEITSVAFGPDNLLATSDGVEVKVWLLDQRLLLTTIASDGEAMGDVAWDGAQRIVVQEGIDGAAAGSQRSHAVAYDLGGRSLGALDPTWQVIHTARGGQLRRVERDGDTLVVQIAGGPERRVVLPEPPGVVSIAADASAVAATVQREDLPDGKGGKADARGDLADLHVWRFDGDAVEAKVFPFPGTIEDIELTEDGNALRMDLRHYYFSSEFASDDPANPDAPGRVEARSTNLVDTRTGTATYLDGGDGHLSEPKGRTVTSPDGTWAATILDLRGYGLEMARAGGEIVWSYDSGSDRAAAFGDGDRVVDVYFPPDAALLIAALADGSMIVLDRETGAVHGRLGAAIDPARHVFPHGDHELVVLAHQQIVRWDLATASATPLGPASGISDLGWVALVGDVIVAADRARIAPDYSKDTWPSNLDVLQLAVGDLDDLPWWDGAEHAEADIRDWPATSAWPPPLDPGGTVWRLPGWVHDVDVGRGHALVDVEVAGADRRACSVMDLRGGGPHALAGVPGDCAGYDWIDAYSEAELTVAITLAGDHVVGMWAERASDHVEVRMWDLQGRIEVSGTLPQGPTLWDSRVALAPAGDVLVAHRGEQTWQLAAGGAVSAGAAPATDDERAVIAGGVVQLPGVTLIGFRDQEYLAYTPDGYYAGTSDVGDRIAWVFDDPDEGATFEQYDAVFDRPDLVAARLGGAAAVGTPVARRPPRIAIDPPVVSGGTAHVHAAASSGGRVDRVAVLVDGAPRAQASVCASDGTIDVDVPLHAGINRITAVAFDDAGLKSRWATADVAGPAAATPPKVWVVAVGVSAYPHLAADEQLDASDDDARAIADAFRAQAAGGAFSAADVTELIDAEVTQRAVLAALRRLDHMAPDDLAVVFFAGHGVKPDTDATEEAGEMVFLTSEATEALDHGIAWTDVAAALGGARGRVLVLLDACHSGHFSRERVAVSDDLAGAFASGRAGALVFSASKGRQLSYEPSAARAIRKRHRDAVLPDLPETGGAPHGMFTAALLATLDDPAADLDRDGDLEASEWFRAVIERVGRETQGLQTPSPSHNEIQGDLKVAAAPPPP